MPKGSRLNLLTHNTHASLIITFFTVAQIPLKFSLDLFKVIKEHKVIKVLGKKNLKKNLPGVEKAF